MSTIYDKIKNEYFFYLHTPEVNYLAYVLNDQSISLERRLDFAILTVEPLGQISEGLFTAFLPFTRSLADSVCVEYQLFLANLLYKMSRKNVCQLFEANFRSKTDL